MDEQSYFLGFVGDSAKGSRFTTRAFQRNSNGWNGIAFDCLTIAEAVDKTLSNSYRFSHGDSFIVFESFETEIRPVRRYLLSDQGDWIEEMMVLCLPMVD